MANEWFAEAWPARIGGLVVDLNGALLLCSSVAAVALLLCYFRLCRWLAGRGPMEPIAAGGLRLAAARGRLDHLQLLSSLPGFQVDADVGGWTPLMAAVVQGQAAAAAWLLEHGADIGKQKADGWCDSVLHYAAGRGSVDAVQVLLAYGADAAAKNALGCTPADVAAKAGHKEVASLLKWKAVAEGRHEPLPRQAVVGKYTGASAAASVLRSKLSSGPAAAWPLAVHINAGVGSAPDSQLRVPQKLAMLAPAAAAAGSSDAAQAGGLPPAGQQDADALAKLIRRGFEGWGTPGTRPRREMRVFCPLAVATQVLGGVYQVWRALRTLKPGRSYLYSMPWFLAEFASYCLSFCFITGLFYMVERPSRRLHDMLPEDATPHVDILIPTYSEPPEVVEAPTIAALNINWPSNRFTVHILDDGKRPAMAALVRRLAAQCRHMKREANIVYVARDKVKGVPHHAKAGNINSCLLKEGPGKGEFVLVLDCDFIVHPDILERTLGHFYRQRQPGEEGVGGGDWVLKERAAFIQTPQVHCSRFFYGPMLQARDGIGACPCCGTGVVFRRDVLVSMGGQSYGSITEDYNSAMAILSAGHSTMFLNERLSYGLAPESIADVLGQRLRWAMGALQIMMKNNPLRMPGLTTTQGLLFFEAAAHNYLCIPTVMMVCVPLIYLFTGYSPMVCDNLWEFVTVFGSWYTLNRVMMYYLHCGTEGGLQELWRSSQMWFWGAPNQLRAIWKVLVTENALVKHLFKWEIAFVVTNKDKKPKEDAGWVALKAALWVTWPHLLYLAAFTAACVYFIVRAATGAYSLPQLLMYVASLCWGILVVLSIYPLLATLLPRTETEQGWKVTWHQFHTASAKQGGPPAGAGSGELLRGLSQSLNIILRRGHANMARVAPDRQFAESTGAAPVDTQQTSGTGSQASTGMGVVAPDGDVPAANPRPHLPRSRLGPAGTASSASAHSCLPAATQAEVPEQAQSQLSSFGHIGLRHRRLAVLQQTALLTSMVLPERQSSLLGSTSLLMDAHGHVSPISALGQRAHSVNLGPELDNGGSPVARGRQAAGLAGFGTQQALAHLAQLTGTAPVGETRVSIDALDAFTGTLSTSSSAGPVAAPGNELAAAVPPRGSASVAPATAAASSSGAAAAQPESPTLILAGEEPQAALRNSPFDALSMDPFSATEDEQLAPELAAEVAPTGSVAKGPALGSPSPMATQAAAKLVDIATLLSPANASLLLERGESMLVPVMPASIWEHSLMARPDFSARKAPTGSKVFVLLNGAILLSLVAGAVLDFQFG